MSKREIHEQEHNPDEQVNVQESPADTPEIAIAVRIANGYNSSYAAEIGRDISKVYFQPDKAEDLINGEAAELGAASSGD